ncbi:MAG: hypothetical protein CMM83_04905 [Rhodospirillales bacterium]|nr:hypothetical protein [Rhodospirillales bacterium]|tara:strand:- start:2862 stop:3911 length:1050 start_codon:yes stop_codon:yes gene_type:complete
MKENADIFVSIIVPFYNAEKTIERCITSVISQDYEDFELILIDDCGEDAAGDLVKKHSQKDNRIKVFTHNINKGVSAARNTGLKVSKGTHIMFLDSDDYLLPNYLKTMAGLALNVEMVSSSFSIQNNRRSLDLRSHGLDRSKSFGQKELSAYIEKYFLKPYVYTMLVHCWNKLFDAEIIKSNGLEFDETLSQLEDIQFVSRYLRYVKTLKFCDVAGYVQSRQSGANNLSLFSGLGGKQAVEDSLSALVPIGELKHALDKKFNNDVSSSYSHFLSSMSILFCIRMGRRFWAEPSVLALSSINAWLSSRKLRQHYPFYKRVAGESNLLRFSITRLPSFVSVFLLILVARNR